MIFQAVTTGLEMMSELSNNCISMNHASSYYQFQNKLVRFSDHLPKMYNLCQNEDVNEMLFIFDDVELTDNQLHEFENQVYSEFPNLIDLQIYIIRDEDDKDFIKSMLNRFINS